VQSRGGLVSVWRTAKLTLQGCPLTAKNAAKPKPQVDFGESGALLHILLHTMLHD